MAAQKGIYIGSLACKSTSYQYSGSCITNKNMARKRRRRIAKKVEPVRRPRRSIFQGTVDFILSLEIHLSREIMGILLIVLACFLFFSINGTAGPVGDAIAHAFGLLIGIWGIYLTVFLSFLGGLYAFWGKDYEVKVSNILGIVLLYFSFLGLIQVLGGVDSPELMTEISYKAHGGYIGFIGGFVLYSALRETAGFVLVALLLISLILTFNVSLVELFVFVKGLLLGEEEVHILSARDEAKTRPGTLEQTKAEQSARPKKAEEFKVVTSKVKTVSKQKDASVRDVVKHVERKQEALPITNELDENYKWEFPSIDLLDDADMDLELDSKLLKKNAEKIRDKLEQFGIRVTVKDVKVGPTVMQYSLEPAEDVKLSKITNLRDDLKLALAAESLRIEAPIPGKSLVGVEMPNEKRVLVRLKELLLSNNFYKVNSNLRMPLGKSVSGSPLIADLTSMPHLLIAGQTGSGKSMGINSIIVSLLYQNSPKDLRLILVDPKRVELKLYNHLPHLLTPVINDMDKAVNALRWLVTEMMRRYTLLEEVGARNREEYNQKVETEKRIPHIVCIIDELAELMMTGDKKAIEGYICRIAQLARAVGIHLIVATQRPSVDVITGLIKANIPARIAFRVSSAVDSRTILDMIGAEDLLGKGDMLYIPGNASEPTRIQGVFIPTSEVERVINKIKLTPGNDDDPGYEDITSPQEDSTLAGSIFGGEDSSGDDLLKQAIEVIRTYGKASTSLLQRKLRIGYSKAAGILDDLEEMGIVGPPDGSKPREVYLDRLAPEE